MSIHNNRSSLGHEAMAVVSAPASANSSSTYLETMNSLFKNLPQYHEFLTQINGVKPEFVCFPEVQEVITHVKELGEDLQKAMLGISRIAFQSRHFTDEFINCLDLYLKCPNISVRHTFSAKPICYTGNTILMEAIYQLGQSVKSGNNRRRLERIVNLFLDTPGVELNSRCIENDFHGRRSVLGFALDYFLGMSAEGKAFMESIALKIIEKGADTSIRCNSNDDTPLILACDKKFERTVESLIEKGANIHEKNLRNLNTALHVACEKKLPRTVKRLHAAAHRQLIEKISLVIGLMMPTPLVSIIDGYVGMSWFFCVQDDCGHTPLHHIVSLKGYFLPEFEKLNDECFDFLLEIGAAELCNIKNQVGLTPLFTAADRGKRDKVRRMLEIGADHSLRPEKNSYAVEVVEEVRAEIAKETDLKNRSKS